MTVGPRRAVGGFACKNFGRQAVAAAQPVELLVDGRRIEQKKVEFAPDGTATVEFSYRFDAPGDHAVEVRAAGDALDVDNHRYLALPVRQAIRALCIDGRPSGSSFRGAADYLAVALAPAGRTRSRPRAGAGGSRRRKRPVGTQPGRLRLPVPLQRRPIHRQRGPRASDAYLQGGGSVIFFLGDQVLADRYNRELGVAGAGQGRGAAHSARPHRRRGRSPASSASIRWAIGTRSCKPFAAAARPAC